MKYDKLAKVLRECNDCICEEHCPYHEERNNPLRCMTKIVGDAANAIEELTMKLHGDEAAIAGMKQQIERMVVNSGNKPKWIPVSERLPEEDSEVLIFTERRDVIYGTFTDGMFSDDWQYYTPDYVVCWMPLPEPPKEETDG